MRTKLLFTVSFQNCIKIICFSGFAEFVIIFSCARLLQNFSGRKYFAKQTLDFLSVEGKYILVSYLIRCQRAGQGLFTYCV